MLREFILVINPGSTSTKVAIFKDNEKILHKNLGHSAEDMGRFKKVVDQYEYREDMILDWLKEENIATENLSAVVARGGLLRPMRLEPIRLLTQ